MARMQEEGLRGIPSRSPAPRLVASSPDPVHQFQRLKGARLGVDAPLSPAPPDSRFREKKDKMYLASLQRHARR
jgi:hypothetical protein